ncbi:glycosyltransferase family 4 protein [Candidatus Dependentiae bacterium]|nr:glycosyltransferase family 4 protein [Candidatus Dependentiae bacterium]
MQIYGFIKIILIITSIVILFYILFYTKKITYVDAHNLDEPLIKNTDTVISICMAGCSSGMARCALAQHAALSKAGIRSILICTKNTFIAQTAEKLHLPFITCNPFRLSFGKFAWMPGIQAALKNVLQKYDNVLAIHCHYKRDVFTAKKLVDTRNIPVVLTHHMPTYLYTSVREEADGVIAVSKSIAEYLMHLNKQDNIKSPIVAIPPFFDDTRLTSFIPSDESRETFFKKTFNIELKSCPLLVKVAHLYSNIHHKNHPLLFQAMHDLIYKRNTPVQVALAGTGPRLDLYKKMVHELGLNGYVHFLGNTEQTPTIFHYADINVLASSGDAFPLVLLEGGYMKKPTIIAREGCGAADWLIIDQQTGFLFENKNATDLADKIFYVLTHQDIAQTCGNNLYKKIMKDFQPAKTTQAMVAFYTQLHEQKRLRH